MQYSITNYSNIIGIEEYGNIGFDNSTCKAVAIQSLARPQSPRASNTFPKLYL